MTNYKDVKYAHSGASLTAIPTSGVSSGTFADARIAESNVTPHTSAFDDSKIQSDILVIALNQAYNENKSAYNLPNSFVDIFQDDTGIGSETTGDRNASEYWSSTSVDPYTKLLLHMDDTGLTDSSATGHTITKGADAARSSTQSKFGSYSAYFDGTGDYLSWADHSDFDFGTDDFTIDFWIYLTYIDSDDWLTIVPISNYGQMGFGQINTGDDLRYGVTNPGWSTDPTDVVPADSWVHLALIKDGDDIKYYKNGTLAATQSDITSAINMTATWHLMASTTGSYNAQGFVDEFRISNGIARWTSNFTPESSAYDNLYFNATATLISTAQTANASTTKVSGVILYQNTSGTATLGTDLKIYFTANGGTNWTESTPTAAGTFSSGILMAKCPEVTCTAGTDVRYKAVWANQSDGSKETRLQGVGMSY